MESRLGEMPLREYIVTPESLYACGKSAEWLCRAMEGGVSLDSDFFACLHWSIGDIKRPLRAVIEAAKKLPKTKANTAALKATAEALKTSGRRLTSECEDLAMEHPRLKGIMKDVVRQECTVSAKIAKQHGKSYRLAGKRLERTFGISAEAGVLCEFIFILQHFKPVEAYFEDILAIHDPFCKGVFAHMLGFTLLQLQSCIKEVRSCGLLEDGMHNSFFRLAEGIAAFWEDTASSSDLAFCRPLAGKTIPLEEFSIPEADAAYARALLEKDYSAPVHILLYGFPGTGKTSFAHSLARTCGLKAWSVTSRKDDDESDRRASLTACLHMAARHKGSFVLVDEAERLLDTSDAVFGKKTKDKAWLNDFLEQPGRRVIWITNHIEHIDQAVRRRFTFSIHFEALGRRERNTIWRTILMRNRAMSRIPEERLAQLVRDYPVAPAVMEESVVRAKKLSRSAKNFADSVECALRAYMTLRNNGIKAHPKAQVAGNFSLDAVCLESSAYDLLHKCRQVDTAMRESASVPHGCATMLFYGPPGTGKTALARHIATTLDRECLVKRASDLLSPYVGVAERQIAEAFREAEREGAVLVIDEADSFLYSRDIAQRSWETTLVNEFLTALEECRGFCICTTNRRENMDAAAMRRFSHKVAFGYARPEQVKALYAQFLNPLCKVPLPENLERELLCMKSLTPGDFHAVRSQYNSFFGGDTPAHSALVNALKLEQELKVEFRVRRIGFGTGI